MSFSPIQEIALSKASPSKDARSELKPGSYAFDFTVRIQGSLKVGEDYGSKSSQSIPWKQLAIYLLGKVNTNTRDKVVRDFLKAKKASPDGTVQINEDELTLAAEAAAKDLLETTWHTCNGKVTGTPVFSLLTD